MPVGTKKIVVTLLSLLIIITAYGCYSLLRTVKLVPEENGTHLSVTLAPSKLAWPNVGQSAVGIIGNPDITSHGPQSPVPTASVAKLITTLVVLKTKPLQVGQPGPTITLSANDVAIYRNYLAEQGSVVPVVAGEPISEYQMLEAMLLPSANNMADSLAIWAYGSLSAYAQAANSFLSSQGLSQTHVGVDASGFDPSTKSTAHDLVVIGELALQNPVIAGIVSQPTVTGIPLTTTVKNVNFLIGTSGIIGVKTGNTSQAGGVYVSGSRATINHTPITFVTALAGAPTLPDALLKSLPLIQSAQRNFTTESLLKTGTIVGNYPLPWGGSVPVVANADFSATIWNDSPVTTTIQLKSISNKTKVSNSVGRVSIEQLPVLSKQNVKLELQKPIPQPGIWWRLTHPMA